MRSTLSLGMVLAVVLLLVLAVSPAYGRTVNQQPAGGPPVVPGAYYVIFNDTVANPADAANNLAKTHGIEIRHVFNLTGNAFSANIPAGRAEGLRHDPRVESVSLIPQVQLADEVMPTGIDRIDAELVASATAGSSVDVAVLDTGSGPHPDLVVTRIDVTGEDQPWDFDGHGTHVAGTVAATFGNGQDVFGVAPGVTLYGVKVFRANGGTGADDIQAGLEWLVAQANAGNVIEVANMSLTISCTPASACPNLADDTSIPSLVAFHNAVIAAVNAGTTIVVAAGNDSTDANDVIPGGYPEVITVSALTDTDGQPGGNGPAIVFPGSGRFKDDTFAKFSNFGADVDIIGPGVQILSLNLGGGTTNKSGTSMASPHVAGVAALVAANNPGATPAQIQQVLIETGTCRNGDANLGNGCPKEWRDDPDGDTPSLNEPMVNAQAAAAANIGPPNNDPVANNVNLGTVQEDSTNNTWAPVVSDEDGGDTLTCTANATSANGGTVTVESDCTSGSYIPALNFNGPDSFSYGVSDGIGGTDTGTVSISVNAVNDPPVADAGLDQNVATGSPVQLDGTGSSDVDQDPLAYSWVFLSIPAGSIANLSAANTATPTFVADLDGPYEVKLTVSDGSIPTNSDTVVITAATPTGGSTMHVGDLDDVSEKLRKGTWKGVVNITVEDANHKAVANAQVTGIFTQNGSIVVAAPPCTTDGSGTCTIDSGQLPSKEGKATFTVDTVTHSTLIYDASNHDSEGDSDGTSIALSK